MLLVLFVFALGWAFIFVAPDHLVHRDLVPDGLERIKQRHNVRTTLLQSLVGILVLIGAYLSWRQLHISRESQITERFTRAIDQLGSDKIDVRVGGIHALGRIARDSPVDRNTISEILAAFVRTRSPWPPRLPGQYSAEAPTSDVPWLEQRATDIQAALNALGRLPVLPEPDPEDLATLFDASAILSSADLRKVVLAAPVLRFVDCNNSNLESSIIHRADFRKGFFTDAIFKGASLLDSNLSGARLQRADLQDAELVGVNLDNCDLRDANLEGAELKGATLKGARANARTTWPSNFSPTDAGVQFD